MCSGIMSLFSPGGEKKEKDGRDTQQKKRKDGEKIGEKKKRWKRHETIVLAVGRVIYERCSYIYIYIYIYIYVYIYTYTYIYI